VSVLCRAELRAKLVYFLRHERVRIAVVTLDEIEGDCTLEPIGEWQIKQL
jgi:hypothetical protein